MGNPVSALYSSQGKVIREQGIYSVLQQEVHSTQGPLCALSPLNTRPAVNQKSSSSSHAGKVAPVCHDASYVQIHYLPLSELVNAPQYLAICNTPQE